MIKNHKILIGTEKCASNSKIIYNYNNSLKSIKEISFSIDLVLKSEVRIYANILSDFKTF